MYIIIEVESLFYLFWKSVELSLESVGVWLILNLENYLIRHHRIRNTHPKFLQLPTMAKRCSLVDIVPVGGVKWTNEAISAFARVTKDRPMVLCVSDSDVF